MIENIEKQLKTHRRKWLVTGAAGFIGSQICERLLQLGQEVVALDNLSTGLKSNLQRMQKVAEPKQLMFVEGDILDSGLCEQLVAKAEFILHHAAFVSVPKSIENPELCNDINVNGFRNILVSSIGKSVKKIVYASSSAVYGDSPKLPKFEYDIGLPLSPYAASKQANEVDADLYFRAHATSVVGLRYFNVFGPYQDPNGPYAAVIPQWIRAMQAGEQIQIYGDGTNSRDFCYIDNVVNANLLAALSGVEASGQVFNVACGERTTLLELYVLLRKIIGEMQNKKIPDPVFRPERAGDIKHSHASVNLAKSVLGYEIKVGLEDGLRRMLKATLPTPG